MFWSFNILRSLSIALAINSLVACSKKKTDDPAPAASMSWTVNGARVDAATVQNATLTGSGTTPLLTLVGSTSTPVTAVTLTMPKQTGSYTVGANGQASATYSEGSSGVQLYTGLTGNITVTALTATNVTGTFTFTGSASAGGMAVNRPITAGTFNVKL